VEGDTEEAKRWSILLFRGDGHYQVVELLAFLLEDDDDVVSQTGGQGEREEIGGLGSLDLGIPGDGQAESPGVLAVEEKPPLPDQALGAGGQRSALFG
jgi:hypothetical protein